MSFVRRLIAKPWIWSFIAAIAVWLATIAFTQGQGGGGLITAALTFATFFVIVGIGQMFVITLGPGNVDLSIPATITLAGSVAMKVMDTQDSMIAIGLVVALACGLGVGVFNYALILILRIPPIIATLSSSFIIQSTAIAYGRGLRIKPPPLLADFTTAQVVDIPILAICVALLAAAMGVVLHRTVYGRSVLAVGQNIRAPLSPASGSNRSASPPMSAVRSWPRCAAISFPGSPAARPYRWASSTFLLRSPSSLSAEPPLPAATATSPASGVPHCSFSSSNRC